MIFLSVYVDFGKRLSILRQSYKLSQAQLAQKFNMPQSTYAGYESGKRKISLDLIQMFATFFKVSPTFLITGQSSSENKELCPAEKEHIKKYRALDERGKNTVDNLLDYEYYLKNNYNQTHEKLLTDKEIDNEVENYRAELVAERGGNQFNQVPPKPKKQA